MRHLHVFLLLVSTVACAGTTDPSGSPDARPTASARWNATAQRIAAQRAIGPLVLVRNLALISVARYNAVVRAPTTDRGRDPWEAAAAAGASAAALAALYPQDAAALATALQDDSIALSAAGSREADAVVRGIAAGRASAAEVLAYAANDRSNLPFTATLPTGPGLWTSAPPPAVAIGVRFGEARPWVLASGSAVRPSAPPTFGSPEFSAALAEVRAATEARTPAQLAAAVFWGVTVLQNAGPVGWFGELGTRYGEAASLDERAMARMLALVHIAGMDAGIACWDAKYHYLVIRPYQLDPAISVPVMRPNFPAFPSAHSCFSSATAGVLTGLFPERAAELAAQVQEAGDARIWGGLHFRFDITAGKVIGDSVAALVLRSAPGGWRGIPLD